MKVLIDPKALMHVIGTKMDYVDDPLKYGPRPYSTVVPSFSFFLFFVALFQLLTGVPAAPRSEFVFVNPNSKGECGCGESFMTTGSKGSTS